MKIFLFMLIIGIYAVGYLLGVGLISLNIGCLILVVLGAAISFVLEKL